MTKLIQLGIQKTSMAFRPATDRNYTSMFRLFLAFTIFMKLNVLQLTPLMILTYLQFLESNNTSSSSMANHLSKLSLWGVSTQPFQDPRIKYFQKAMTLHRPFKVQFKKVIDIDTLHLIVRTCDSTYMGQVFKAVYTLAFFSFLRLSNLVPHSVQSFSPLYHLARADIMAVPGMHIVIKWSKTIQSRNMVKIL